MLHYTWNHHSQQVEKSQAILTFETNTLSVLKDSLLPEPNTSLVWEVNTESLINNCPAFGDA